MTPTKVSALRQMPDGSFVSVSDIRSVRYGSRGDGAVVIQYKNGGCEIIQNTTPALVVAAIKALEPGECFKQVTSPESP